MDLHRLATLFDSHPVEATFFMLVITITAVAVIISATVGAFSARDWLKKRHEDRLRNVAVAQHAEPV